MDKNSFTLKFPDFFKAILLSLIIVFTVSSGNARTTPVYTQELTLNLTGNGYADVTRILFGPTFTDSLNYGYDAFKLVSGSGHPSVYTNYKKNNPDTNFSILALPLLTVNQQDIPVDFVPGATGQFTFSFNLDGFDPTALIFLEDLKTHTIQNLMVNPVYIFSGYTSDNISRFVLHFFPSVAISVTPADCKGQNGLLVANLGQYTVDNKVVAWTNYILTANNGTVAAFGNLTNNLISLANLPSDTYTLQININGYIISKQVTISNQPIVTAAFVPDSFTVLKGDTVAFTNTSLGATTYTWNFGDGNTSVSTSPNHTYSAIGNYPVTLIATNAICSDTVEKNITVDTLVVIIPPDTTKTDTTKTDTTKTDTTKTGIYDVQTGVVKITGYNNNVSIEFFKFTILDEVALNIYDITGRKVIATQQISTGDNKNIIYMNGVVSGYYFVVLTRNGYKNAGKVFLSGTK